MSGICMGKICQGYTHRAYINNGCSNSGLSGIYHALMFFNGIGRLLGVQNLK